MSFRAQRGICFLSLGDRQLQSFRNLLEACSICSTRRGSLVAFDDACITSGLVITTPPCATRRSARSIPLARRRTSSSVSTPARCVPGRTRRGPKSVARNGHASAPGISRALPIISSLAAIGAAQRSLIRRRTPARLLGRSLLQSCSSKSRMTHPSTAGTIP
jgi:hypothetical protein